MSEHLDRAKRILDSGEPVLTKELREAMLAIIAHLEATTTKESPNAAES